MRISLSALSNLFFEDDFEELKPNPIQIYKFNLKVFAGASLTKDLSKLALSAKEDNNLLARKNMARLIVAAMKDISVTDLNIVPIPSRKVANRMRGINHIDELVKEVNKIREVKVYKILRHNRKILDQSTLSAKARMENLWGAFEVKGSTIPKRIYLLDDLVTTGATIRAAAAALTARNIEVLGVIAACASVAFTD